MIRVVVFLEIWGCFGWDWKFVEVEWKGREACLKIFRGGRVYEVIFLGYFIYFG